VADPPPYFFLSHAGAGAGARHLGTLYDLLRDHLYQLTATERPGFVSFQEPVGGLWLPDVCDAVLRCRVFVPVYSPHLFASWWCGWEWQLFRAREQAHGRGPSAIVPVLWTSPGHFTLPPCAAGIQYRDHRLGETYAAEGFYGVLCTEPVDRLTAVTYWIARRIVEAAVETDLPPGGPVLADRAVCAFPGVPQPPGVPGVTFPGPPVNPGGPGSR
jgi:hypothetical protein